MFRSNLLVASVLSACWLTATCKAQCPAAFQPQVTYSGMSLPEGIAAGDFNHDGLPDLAISNYGRDGVAILLGQSPPEAGTFQPPVHYFAGASPASVITSDLNADGSADLVVATNNGISILLGNPDGTFRTAVRLSLSVAASAAATGDFNADGRPDIAVCVSNGVVILLQDESGVFHASSQYPAGSVPADIVSADFNADGALDLALVNRYSDNLQILSGNNDGTFRAPAFYQPQIQPRAIVTGDFNADGRPDLAVANGASDSVSIFLNTPEGRFLPAVNYDAGFVPSSLTIGDFNADGIPDLAISDYYSHSVSILSGNLQPDAGIFRAGGSFAVGAFPLAVVASDFNFDGRPDLAVANVRDNSISILLSSFCPADFNCSDSVNSQDFNDFLAAFFSLSPAADFNHDTFINSQDFFAFLTAFLSGC